MNSIRFRVAAVVVLAALAAALAYYFADSFLRFWDLLVDVTAHKEKLRRFVQGFGPFAPLAFIGIQVSQVVVSPFPGELTGFVGGLLFGASLGTVLSTIGLTLGSWLAFFLGRALGRPFVERLITRSVVEKFSFLLSRRGTLVVFLCYLIPGFPKDYLSYLVGLSPMRTSTFLWICALGRLPGTLLLSLQGAKVYQGEIRTVLFIAGVALLLVAVLTYFQEPIRAWLSRRRHT
ncbi:MAG: TVP38/TMEM64 family protein [Nitrospinota bacterium]